MANTTASASGVKRYFAGPVRNTTETKTMQMASVETNAGTAICCALDRFSLSEVAVNIFELNRGVVDKNADRQGEAAKRHHVERVAEQGQDRQRRQDR